MLTQTQSNKHTPGAPHLGGLLATHTTHKHRHPHKDTKTVNTDKKHANTPANPLKHIHVYIHTGVAESRQ